MLTIIDYQVGNLQSIRNMLRKVSGRDVCISESPDDIAAADKLILPGVGHFDYGMKQLKQSGLVDVLNKRVLDDKVPILGICLGAQLLTRGSEEGIRPGLGWIDAYTRRFRAEDMPAGYKVPHMGWGDIRIQQPTHPLFLDFLPNPRFYFVHSYHIVCEDKADELAECQYGYPFTAGVARGNIMGVQFHPEKSHKYGMTLLRNFVNLEA